MVPIRSPNHARFPGLNGTQSAGNAGHDVGPGRRLRLRGLGRSACAVIGLQRKLHMGTHVLSSPLYRCILYV